MSAYKLGRAIFHQPISHQTGTTMSTLSCHIMVFTNTIKLPTAIHIPKPHTARLSLRTWEIRGNRARIIPMKQPMGVIGYGVSVYICRVRVVGDLSKIVLESCLLQIDTFYIEWRWKHRLKICGDRWSLYAYRTMIWERFGIRHRATRMHEDGSQSDG